MKSVSRWYKPEEGVCARETRLYCWVLSTLEIFRRINPLPKAWRGRHDTEEITFRTLCPKYNFESVRLPQIMILKVCFCHFESVQNEMSDKIFELFNGNRFSGWEGAKKFSRKFLLIIHTKLFVRRHAQRQFIAPSRNLKNFEKCLNSLCKFLLNGLIRSETNLIIKTHN